MTKPRFTAERLVPRYADSEDGRLMYLRHLFAYQEVARRISGAGVVIDIGCGEGYGTAVLATAARRVTGFDVDPESIDHASQSYGMPGRCEFRRYDGARIPLPHGGVDAAVSMQVIEHVYEDEAFVAEAARVLSSGGLCVLTTPNRLLRLSPGERPWNRYHIREYDADDLGRLLRPHFQTVEILGISGDQEAQAHELERLAWVRRTAARDPLRLRRLLPESLKRQVLFLLRGKRGRAGSAVSVSDWDTDRYHVTTDVGGALDLFAVCRR